MSFKKKFFNFKPVPYVLAKFLEKEKEYRCGVSECNKLLFKGEIVTGSVEKKCSCGYINIIDIPVRKYGVVGSYQDSLKLTKK